MSPIDTIITDIRQGRMVILVDDEHRENEGDLVVAAEHATPEAVNFMAKHGRGLICLTLTQERVDALGLPLMAQRNASRHQTAFTLSIEAREGVTTGISAFDRARTIATAIDPLKTRVDLVTPGHVFPLVAKEGGVLVRAGHTEASVDLARLAGLNPSAVICEIMHDDGTMARLPDLQIFAAQHGLNIASIADLIAWRRRKENLVRCTETTRLYSRHGGEFELRVYVNTVTHTEHLVLIKGEIHPDRPQLVRMHALNMLEDVLADADSPRTGSLHAAMARIGEVGEGVIVILRESQPDMLSRLVAARRGKTHEGGQLRDYGVGAQILLDLGIRQMRLLTSSRKTVVVALEGYGLEIISREPFDPVFPANQGL
jgi:3,4-dihydroxy 2-butanone 4-phosphate synthase / GTP cyclohydrolase II